MRLNQVEPIRQAIFGGRPSAPAPASSEWDGDSWNNQPKPNGLPKWQARHILETRVVKRSKKKHKYPRHEANTPRPEDERDDTSSAADVVVHDLSFQETIDFHSS